MITPSSKSRKVVENNTLYFLVNRDTILSSRVRSPDGAPKNPLITRDFFNPKVKTKDCLKTLHLILLLIIIFFIFYIYS